MLLSLAFGHHQHEPSIDHESEHKYERSFINTINQESEHQHMNT